MEDSNTQSDKKLEVAEKIAVKYGLRSGSKDSFIELCKKGCDPNFLSDKLLILRSTIQVYVTTTIGKGTARMTTTQLTSLRPLDAIETSLGGFKPKDLKSLQKQLIDMAHKVESLNYSAVVSELNVGRSPDIYNLPEVLLRYANEILPLVIERTKTVGAKYKPDFNRNIREIVEHAEATTGEPRYKLIADILEGIEVFTNEEALKQNIYRQRSGKEGNAK